MAAIAKVLPTVGRVSLGINQFCHARSGGAASIENKQTHMHADSHLYYMDAMVAVLLGNQKFCETFYNYAVYR